MAEDIPRDLENCVLDPTKLQTMFKQYFDKAMFEIDLPPNWEHGGYHKPNYSGCRRHGPATLIQLIHRTKEKEIKLTVDITLGIAVPLPVDLKQDLNMDVFNKIDHRSPMYRVLQDAMKTGPQVHLIPLYSKMLVKTGRYDNKFSFRISCSCIEKALLNAWPDDSGPKKCIRILKAIRDKYFSEGQRKTCRNKKRHKKRWRNFPRKQQNLEQPRAQQNPKPSTNSQEQQNKSSSPTNKKKQHTRKRKRMAATEFVEKINVVKCDWLKEMERFDTLKAKCDKDTVHFSADDESDEDSGIDQPKHVSSVSSEGTLSPSGIDQAEHLSPISSERVDFQEPIQQNGLVEQTLDFTASVFEKLAINNKQENNMNDCSLPKITETKTFPCNGNENSSPAVDDSNEWQYNVISEAEIPLVPETTDITEWHEEKTKEEALMKFQLTRMTYQSKDISGS